MRRLMSYLLLLLIFLFGFGLMSTQSFALDSLQKGIEEYNAENYDESLQLFKEARQQKPDSSTAAYYLGLAYEQIGQISDAVEQLKDAVSMMPVEKKAYTNLVEILYRQNNSADAKLYIQQAEQAEAAPADLAYLRGLVCLLDGRNSEAVDSFIKAKELDPSLAQKADLHTGIAYAQERRIEDARASLNAAVNVNPSSELADYAREYESSLAGMVEQMKKWSFMVGAAVQYDDNVVAKPLSDIPGVDDVTGEDDISIVAMFNVDYKRHLRGPWFLNAGYRIFANNYSEINSHNLLVQKLSVTPGRNINGGNIFFPIEYHHIILDDSGYASLLSLKPTIKFMLNPGNIGVVSLGLLHRDMLESSVNSNEDRDGNVYSIGLGYVHPTFEGKGVFKAGYERWTPSIGQVRG
ncbi:MAG: tetratricopeptide repeat protein [Thermodesulfovibrionia bacterium]|nr:tetratricopeptide repeat protein [Thermodesulfovibrionia bacterium]